MSHQLLEFEQLFQWVLRYGQPLNDGQHTMVTSRVLQQFIQEVPNAQYIMQRAQELNYLSPTGDPNIFAIPDDILHQYRQLVGFHNPQGGQSQGRIDQYSSYDANQGQGGAGGFDPYGGDDDYDDYDDDDYYDDGVDEWYDEDDSRSLIFTGAGIGIALVSVFLSMSSSTLFVLVGVVLGIGGIVVSGLAIKEAMDYDESGIKKAIPAIGIIIGLLSVMLGVITVFNAPKSPEQLQGEEAEELVVEEPEEEEPEIIEEEEQAEVLPPISDDYRENVSIEIAPVEHMQDQTGMIFTRLPLTITNIRSTPLSYDIQLQAMDEEGEFIGSPEFVISIGLEPGETTERYAYEYLTNDLALAITQPGVRFEIIDVSTSHLTRSEIPEDNTVVNPVDDLDIPEDLDPRNQGAGEQDSDASLPGQGDDVYDDGGSDE